MISRASHFVPSQSKGLGKVPFLRFLLRIGLRAFCSIEVTGGNHIPRKGGCVVVFNHVSNFDPFVLYAVANRSSVLGLVAASYRAKRMYRWLVEAGGNIWLQRGAADRAALETAIVALRSGVAVAVAPEGGRSRDGVLRRGHRGPAFIAVRAGAPVIPIGLVNTGRLARRWRRFRRVRVEVRIGAPIHLPPLAEFDHRGQLNDFTDLIMKRLAGLLPRELRGVYQDLPVIPKTAVPPEPIRREVLR